MSNKKGITVKIKGDTVITKDTRSKKAKKADAAAKRGTMAGLGFMGSSCTRVIPDKKHAYSRARSKAEARCACLD